MGSLHNVTSAPVPAEVYYPHPRRVVTGHDAEGNAVVVKDSYIPSLPTGANSNYAVLWETHEFPAKNNEFEDPILRPTTNLANPHGLVLRVVDFKPNTKTMFHRTCSLDFGIVFDGEIVCYLDRGDELVLRSGDVCIQRGTIHGWDNRTDKPARMYFILSAAKPVVVGTTLLGETGFDSHHVTSGGTSLQ